MVDNVYATLTDVYLAHFDLICLQARIHPLQVAASLSKEQCAALHKCVKEVGESASSQHLLQDVEMLFIEHFLFLNVKEEYM